MTFRVLIWRCLFIIGVMGYFMPAWAEDTVAIPTLSSPITDTVGILSAEENAQLNQKLQSFSQTQGSQIAVLIVASTQPEAIFDYSFRVAENWKLGRKGVDDGVLLVLAINDRKSQLQIGYGLEGAIPDLRSKQILQEILKPYLKQGQYYAGINAATDALITLIKGENLPAPKAQAQHSQQGQNTLVKALIAGVFIGFILRLILGNTLGSLAAGGSAMAIALWLGAGIGIAFIALLGAAFFSMSGIGPALLSGGGGSRGGGNIFSGGGGGFGGGGASGDW